MKTFYKIPLSILLVASVFLNTANAAVFKYSTDQAGKTTITTRAGAKVVVDPSKAYKPNKLDYLRLANFKDSMDRTVARYVKAKGNAYALSYARKLGAQYVGLYMDNSKNAKNAYYYSRASNLAYDKAKELEGTAVSVPVTPKPSVTNTPAPSTTKQLSSDETKKVVDIVNTVKSLPTNSSSIPMTDNIKKQYESIGLSKVDSEVMAMHSYNGDDIFFCSAFTPELYPVEMGYGGDPQHTTKENLKKFEDLSFRILEGGEMWFTKKHLDIYTARSTQWQRIRGCAGLIRTLTHDAPYTQADMKQLFDKLNLTFTPQTKAVYDTGVDLKDLDAWVKKLGNGKQKQ